MRHEPGRVHIGGPAVLKHVRDAGPTGAGMKSLMEAFEVRHGGDSGERMRWMDLMRTLADLEAAGLVLSAGAPNRSYAWAGPYADAESAMRPEAESVWTVSALLWKVQVSLGLSLSELAERESAPNERSDTFKRIAQVAIVAEATMQDSAPYRADLAASLREMAICFDCGCFIAVLSLAGKILEIALKHRMLCDNIEFQKDWMIGTLAAKLREEQYVDPSLSNVINIINASRIPAVHAKLNIPIPSQEQALMVIAAVLDTLARTVLSATSADRRGR